MTKYTHRTAGAPIRRGTPAPPARPMRTYSLAAEQDAVKAAPNDRGVPVTPTEYAPGATSVDLDEMQRKGE
jgi:hypothetical protein